MVTQDPDAALTLAAQAWQAWAQGNKATAQRLASAAVAAVQRQPRRERQHVQVVHLAVTGDLGRASGLAAEHLAEFPDDELIRRVRAACRY